MGVYWFLVNLNKGGYVGKILGKTGEFDFQEEYEKLAGDSKDTFVFVSDGFKLSYIPYPFKEPPPVFPGLEDHKKLSEWDEKLIEWELENSKVSSRKIKLNDGRTINFDEDTRRQFIENLLPESPPGSPKKPLPKASKKLPTKAKALPKTLPLPKALPKVECGAKTKTGTCKVKVEKGERCWRHASGGAVAAQGAVVSQEGAKGKDTVKGKSGVKKVYALVDEWYGDDGHVDVLGIYSSLASARKEIEKFISSSDSWKKGTGAMEGYYDSDYPEHFIRIHECELK